MDYSQRIELIGVVMRESVDRRVCLTLDSFGFGTNLIYSGVEYSL